MVRDMWWCLASSDFSWHSEFFLVRERVGWEGIRDKRRISAIKKIGEDQGWDMLL